MVGPARRGWINITVWFLLLDQKSPETPSWYLVKETCNAMTQNMKKKMATSLVPRQGSPSGDARLNHYAFSRPQGRGS